MGSLPKWVADNFVEVQRIAARHDIHCKLRIAMMGGDPELICNCNGKLSVFGKPKTKPREKTLQDVKDQLGIVDSSPEEDVLSFLEE